MDELTTSQRVPLRRDRLDDLPASIKRPHYAAKDLSPGIIHIGVGNFHRAHQAWYLHRLMQQGLAWDWAIVGAGVRPADTQMRERLKAQDYLTTLIELQPNGRSAEVVGSMVDFLPVAEGNAALIDALSHASTRIVALTVTESGYFLNAGTGAFDAAHADIQHDLTHPNSPKTAFGAIVAALSKRRAAGLGPFTVQSCDNLQGNGDVTRATVLGLARQIDPDLADWIGAECTFPNSMVDCIVPATGEAERALSRSLGLEDAAPVTHENFRQWVIEDKFCTGRPDWDKVGATFTDHVHEYEAMKIRILNAGHQVLANAGELLSTETIAEAMTHPLIKGLFRKVQRTEIVPYVKDVPGMTPLAYLDLIEERFANPAIHDTTRRVAFDGSSRHPGFVLPIVQDAIAAGGSVSGLALVEAVWARMCAGTREDGSEIPANDPMWPALVEVAHQARANPQVWLGQGAFYGRAGDNAAFADAFAGWLRLIWAEGTEQALRRYAQET